MIMITLTTLRFDSDILEGQYWRSTFPRTTRRFQLGLFYILIMCLVSFDQDDMMIMCLVMVSCGQDDNKDYMLG